MKIARSLKVFEITGTHSSFILAIRIDIFFREKKFKELLNTDINFWSIITG
jgi:hypothetical protein